MLRSIFCFVLVIGVTYQVTAQKELKVKGMVSSFDEQPISDAVVFLNYANTGKTTNHKGLFRIKVPRRGKKVISIYSPEHGVISHEYQRERRLDFIYPEEVELVDEADLGEMGFNLELPRKDRKKWYGDYTNVLDILDDRFSQVRVRNGRIIVGRGGPHVFASDQDPLVLLDGQPFPVSSLGNIVTTEIESIKVIHKGSELATYGFRGVNGVIEINLKNGE